MDHNIVCSHCVHVYVSHIPTFKEQSQLINTLKYGKPVHTRNIIYEHLRNLDTLKVLNIKRIYHMVSIHSFLPKS